MSVDRTMGAVSNSTMTEKNRGTRFGNARRVSAFASAQIDVPYPETMDYRTGKQVFPFIDIKR